MDSRRTRDVPPGPQRPAPAAKKRPAKPKLSAAKQMEKRLRLVMVCAVVVVVAVLVRLAWVQVVWGPALADKAVDQRTRIYDEPARRGAITDRNGQVLAYTMQARSLTVSPTRLREELRQQELFKVDYPKAYTDGLQDISEEERHQELDKLNEIQARYQSMNEEERAKFLDERVDGRLRDMANGIPRMIEEAGASTDKVDAKEILDKLNSDTAYQNLVHNVDPDVAVLISQKYHGVAADRQDIRQYPNGAIGENVVGKVGADGIGQFGLETSWDGRLRGSNGKSKQQISARGQFIPGTLEDVAQVRHGDSLQLTLDLDLQTFVQQKLEKAVQNSQAKSGEAVVLDVATGEVLAMANTGTIDPTKNIQQQLDSGRSFGNPSVSAPFEPGSVAKIITASATIEEGLTTPDEVLQVPGSIEMAGVTVSDAWSHGVLPYTTTGIFGKSSNVGTLMLAQRLGEDKYADYLKAFGLGQVTGVELPNESAGILPDRSQWSGGTFANLPIGQGMSWTALQLASVYQTVANGGERIEPRIVEQQVSPDGKTVDQPKPKKTRVVSEETARTVVDMFRAVFQSDPRGIQNGTAGGAGLEGYQLSGKTGTAQQVVNGAYSNSNYWITFAGIAPADNPRFVVSIMLDKPQSGVNDDGSGGQSAAPVFRDIAQWLLDRENLPPSPEAPPLVLQAE